MSSTRLFRTDFERALAERIRSIKRSDVSEPGMLSSSLTDWAANPAPAAAEVDLKNRSLDVNETRRHLVRTHLGIFWVTGSAVLCECPDCSAPMTVRCWLALADCWRCGANIRLTQLQIDMIEEAMQQQAANERRAGDVESESNSIRAAILHPVSVPASIAVDEITADAAIEELHRLTRASRAARLLRRGLSSIPAWLLSFLLHALLIILLALFVFRTASQPPAITLSSFVGPENKLGGDLRIENPQHALADDLAMAIEMDVAEDEMRDILQAARAEAAELTQHDAQLSILPDLDQAKKNLTTSRNQLMSFAARDPRLRSEIVKQQGGTSLTEAAVARGLRWLASVQNQDGSWSLANYDKCKRSSNLGDSAGTSLALLPFLGAGQTHESGIHSETVARGLAWLIKNQKPDGDLRINFPNQAGMYAHGQATIVLCESLAMTGDQQFKIPAQKAIQFIERAQHQKGGWRYLPKQDGDTSVLGWQLMALQSARAGNLGLDVESATFKLADYYLDQAVDRRQYRTGTIRNLPIGSLYTYRPGEGRASPAMTAEAILCRMYLGWRRDDPRVIEAVRWLIEDHLPEGDAANAYYWYYATQVMHHFGGKAWDIWNRRMREVLVVGQEKSGRYPGSWDPANDEWGRQGGRIFVTSFAVCTLEVYYRHLPLFDPIQLESSPVSVRR